MRALSFTKLCNQAGPGSGSQKCQHILPVAKILSDDDSVIML